MQITERPKHAEVRFKVINKQTNKQTNERTNKQTNKHTNKHKQTKMSYKGPGRPSSHRSDGKGELWFVCLLACLCVRWFGRLFLLVFVLLSCV